MRTARMAGMAALVLSVASGLPLAGTAQAATGGTIAKNSIIPGAGMAYIGSWPTRVLDTRDGTGAPKGSVGPGGTIRFSGPSTGDAGPMMWHADVLVVNLTVTDPTADGYVTAYEPGTSRPNVSSLNFKAGQTVSNQVVVPVGSDGTVRLYNHSGNVQLIADVMGGYSYDDHGGYRVSYQGVGARPERALDTRSGIGARAEKVGANGTVKFKVGGVGGVPKDAGAVILNVTATNPTAASYVAAGAGMTPPGYSNLNFAAGQTVANQVIAGTDGQGYVTLYNHSGDVDLIADVQGYYGGSSPYLGSFFPTVPTRLLDTRDGTGGATKPIGNDDILRLKVTGSAGIPEGATTVLVNLTATNPTSGGFLTAYAAGAIRPNTSIVNFTPGATVPNLAYVPVSADGYIEIYNRSGSTDAIVDVQGYLP